MRCISPFKNYSIQVFEGEEELIVDGRGFGNTRILKKPVTLDFEQSGLLDHEIELALSSFTFAALPEGVNPISRVSVLDTEVWAMSLPKKGRDEYVVQVEARLRELQNMHPTDFIIVETPKAPKPWGSYDEDKVEDILAFQERLNINPTLVRRYEQENSNRDEIVEHMTLLEDPNYVPPAPEPEVESVATVQA